MATVVMATDVHVGTTISSTCPLLLRLPTSLPCGKHTEEHAPHHAMLLDTGRLVLSTDFKWNTLHFSS